MRFQSQSAQIIATKHAQETLLINLHTKGKNFAVVIVVVVVCKNPGLI